MYLGGTSHLFFHIITLLNCILTYSANFSEKQQQEREQEAPLKTELPNEKMLLKINSTLFHTQQKHEGKCSIL